MFLYFENWSIPTALETLKLKHLPHTNTVIKILASPANPKLLFPHTYIYEIADQPFSTEKYLFLDSIECTGYEIERKLNRYRLSPIGSRMARSLFRFAHLPTTRLFESAMTLSKDSARYINHPLEIIDRISCVLEGKPEREATIHLDVFLPESLYRLKELFDYTKPNSLLSFKEGHKLRQEIPSLLLESPSLTSPEKQR